MHFMSQPRYNPKTQCDDWYYRIKESFRDLTGRVAEKDGEFYRIVTSQPHDGRGPQSKERERWFDGDTGFVYEHRPVERYRGFVIAFCLFYIQITKCI